MTHCFGCRCSRSSGCCVTGVPLGLPGSMAAVCACEGAAWLLALCGWFRSAGVSLGRRAALQVLTDWLTGWRAGMLDLAGRQQAAAGCVWTEWKGA